MKIKLYKRVLIVIFFQRNLNTLGIQQHSHYQSAQTIY